MVSRLRYHTHEFPSVLVRFKSVYVLARVPGTTVLFVRIDSTEHQDRFSIREKERVVEIIAVRIRTQHAAADPLRPANM